MRAEVRIGAQPAATPAEPGDVVTSATEPEWVSAPQPRGAGAAHRIRVQSSDTAPQERAYQEAVEAAIVELGPIVRSRAGLTPSQARALGSNRINTHIAAAVRSGQIVAEDYERRTDRSYGTTWKHYILMDTSPARLEPIVQRIRGDARMQLVNEATAWGSLGALLGVIVLLYVFLNAATRGYFAWRLRAAAVMLVIVAVLVVFAIA
jgi:hypothetical protein